METQHAARRSPLTRHILTASIVLAGAAIVIAVTRPAHGLPIPRGSTVVHIDERDFAIHMQTTLLHTGNYVFVDRNHGPSAHELVMWKTPDPANRLPLRANHRVNEEAPELESTIDSGSSLQPGETRILTANLEPGHYVIVCDLPGHYLAGMHVDITVS
jgi:uncharacterized cupredoxin-like copper-binding protein